MSETIQGKWIKIEQNGGNAPGPRCSHSMAVVGDKLYMFGGELKVNTQIDKDLYVFDFNTGTWSIAPANGEAPTLSCFGVRMVAVGTKIYIFGGRDEHRNFSDFYSYDTVKEEWKFLTKLDQGEGLEVRTFHSMTSDDNHVYVFGGVSKGGSQVAPYRLRTVEAYNIANGVWSQLRDPGKNFEKRGGSGFVVVQGKIWVVFGMASSIEEGGKNNYESNKIQYFDLVSGKWTEVKTTGAKPTGRSVFAHAVIGKYIIIFGGEAWMDQEGHRKPGTLSNEGYALNTETLIWTKLVDQSEPETPVGWTANTTATVYGMKGLLMHGGKQPFNNRIDDLYFYTISG